MSGTSPRRQKSEACGQGTWMNLIHEDGKARAAGGTAGTGTGGTMRACLSEWCNIVICLEEKRAVSLHQGLDPKSTEVKEGLLTQLLNWSKIASPVGFWWKFSILLKQKKVWKIYFLPESKKKKKKAFNQKR